MENKTFTQKLAFTLAEVLITLGIIGVVSALTLPTLIKNYQKNVTVAQFKKIYSTLNSALMSSISENGSPNTWVGLGYNDGDGREPSEILASYFIPYLKVQKVCAEKHKSCWPEKMYAKDKKSLSSINSAYIGYSVILDDGTILRFFANNGNHKTYPFIAVDLNGIKPPNTSGYDEFLFALDLRSTSKNSLYYSKIGPFGDIKTRENLLNGSSGCNNTGIYGGYACAGLIIYDNFQIKNDYNW